MPKYRIQSSRHDIPRHTIESFTAENDQKAKEHFRNRAEKKEHAWDDLDLERIIQEEKVARLGSAFRDNGELVIT